MRIASLFSALCAATLTLADPRSAQIYIQPIISHLTKPTPLAEISYDPLTPSSSQIVTYEAPELPEDATLIRIGQYDTRSSTWLSGTTVASVENFSKGYSPNIILTVDQRRGDVLSAALKGVAIDAGQTRDFGPQAKVVVEGPGKMPDLNKPVVLSPEGKKVEEQEKTFLQKYVYAVRFGQGVVSTNSGQILVDVGYCGILCAQWRRLREVDDDSRHQLIDYRLARKRWRSPSHRLCERCSLRVGI